jgi:hypothetical protein
MGERWEGEDGGGGGGGVAVCLPLKIDVRRRWVVGSAICISGSPTIPPPPSLPHLHRGNST